VVHQGLFRDVMSKFASGVVVVTTAGPKGYHGVTVSASCSVSLDPPLVLICIDRAIQSHHLIADAPSFAINILSRSQSFLAEQFSGRTPLADPTFSRVPHHLGMLEIPLIDGCLAWIECRPWTAYDAGDHSIFVGQVENLALGDSDDPLIYFDRQFTELSWG
jgi:flavin reductase (DIM6/NTAB) family NADH-FMN oxidoreductase RutF